MRISGAGRPAPAGARSEVGRADTAAGGFVLSRIGPGATGEIRSGGPLLPLSSLDALMALQAVPDALQRRRRAVRHGGDLLDGLDEIRLALLDGSLPAEAILRLRTRLAAAREASDDPGLDDLLREIEVRAAVELAKLEQGAKAA